MFFFVVFSFLSVAWTQAPAPTTVKFSVSSDGTSYSISLNDEKWLNSASTYFRNNKQDASMSQGTVTTYQGSDNIGEYQATEITYVDSNDGTTKFINTFRQYTDVSDVITFTQSFPQGLSSPETGSTSNSLISSFPSFNVDSGTSDINASLGYIHFAGFMASGTSSQSGQWVSGDGSQSLKGGLDTSGTLCIFKQDLSESMVISPLDNFMAHNTLHTNDEYQFGLLGNLTSIPAGYEISFILVGRNSGVNSAMRHWGRYMLSYYNKDMDNSWARDYTLQYLGYSTDNGAFYYYNTEPNKNYQETMLDLYNYTSSINLPIKYILYDSWWYYQGQGGGLANWTARPDIFPDGLEYMYDETGWKVQAHSRYFSLDTVYATNSPDTPSPGYSGEQFLFQFGDSNGVPSNIDFWNYLFGVLNNKWGLIVYEQDWLSKTTDTMSIFSENATFGREWLLQMGYGALNNDLSIQYCMSYTRHVLTSLELDSVTNARASDDYHPSNTQWELGYSGLFTSSIGIAPSKDDYWTTQIPQYQPHYSTSENVTEFYPRLESLIASMSNGPVQPSDQIGYMNRTLIMMACNDEGLLLRPDISVSGIDNYFLNHAFGSGGVDGTLYTTHTAINNWIYTYVLAVEINTQYDLQLSDLSHHFESSTNNFDEFLAYEANTTDKFVPMDSSTPLTIAPNDRYTFVYYTIIPVDTSISKGWYLQGEINKWIRVSRQRFEAIDVSSDGITVKLVGTQGETVFIGFVNYATMEQKIIDCTFTETLVISMECTGSSSDDLSCVCNNF